METVGSHAVLNGVFAITVIMFLASCLFLLTKSRFKFIPFPVALLFLGIILSPFELEQFEIIRLTPGTVLFIFLPILLFESAYKFEFAEFKRVLTPAFLYATIGVLFSTIVIGFGITAVFHIPLLDSMLFASLISSTDPIAILAVFKQLGVPKRLQLLVDAESFINDATSIILFRIILATLAGTSATIASPEIIFNVSSFFYVLIGGGVIGLLAGVLISEIISLIENESLVEITLTIVLASIVFILSEDVFHVSGILAVLTAGLVVGNYGKSKISPGVIANMEKVWEFLVFVVTSLVFILVGYEINILRLVENWQLLLLVLVLVYLSRAIYVYGIGLVQSYFSKDNKIPFKWLHVVNLGGLRGVLPVVIGLSLAENYVYPGIFLELILGSVLVTFTINALIITPVISLLNLDKPDKITKIETSITEVLILYNMLNYIKGLRDKQEIGEVTYKEHSSGIKVALNKARVKLKELCFNVDSLKEENRKDLERIIRRFCLHIEKSVYNSLYKKKVVNEELFLRLNDSINKQIEQIFALGQEFSFQQTDIAAKFEKIKRSRYTLGGLIRRVLGGKGFDDIVKDTYTYYKVRLLGDDKVLEELDKFVDCELDILDTEIIKKISSTYKHFRKYNLDTLKYISENYPNHVVEVDEHFFQNESEKQVEKVIQEFGEDEIVSSKALQELRLII